MRSKYLRLGASAVLLAFLGWQTDWDRVANTFAGLNWSFWGLGVALYALTQVFSSVRWQLLSRPLGFRRPLRQYVGMYYVGMLFNLVLPTSVGGDVVRAWYLDARSGRRSAALVSVLLDRGSGLLVLIALACVATFGAPAGMPRWIDGIVWGLATAAVIGLAALGLFVHRTPRLARLRPALQAARSYLSRPGLLIGIAVLSVIVQVANVALVWLLGEALGLNVPPGYYGILVPVVTLLTLVPVSLNGMGVRELATAYFLAPLGVAPEAALSLAFLWFATFTVTSLAGIGFYLGGQFPRVEVRADDESFADHSDQGRARQSPAAA